MQKKNLRRAAPAYRKKTYAERLRNTGFRFTQSGAGIRKQIYAERLRRAENAFTVRSLIIQNSYKRRRIKMNKSEELKKIVAQYTEVKAEDITDDMRFREDLELSSLDFMSLLGELEDTFDVELDQEEVLKVRTIGDAIKMLNSLTEE